MAGLVIGIDIGGTFTDLVALDTASRQIFSSKILTTQNDPNQAVAAGILALFSKHGLDRHRVERVVHATTLFTNALVQRNGAKVGLLTTAGFADTLALRRERKFELYDLGIKMPDPLVPSERRLEVQERVDAKGAVLKAINESEILATASKLLNEGCESIAIAFLNSFINPENEKSSKRILHQRFPDVSISVSHEVANEIREFERFSTTVANAFIAPLAQKYLGQFRACIEKDCGIVAPIYLMLSSGGLAPLDVARRNPIALLESGPAAGALAAAWFARQVGIHDLLALDLGGTTAKLCVIENGTPLIARRFEAAREKRFIPESGLPLCLASVDLIEIGAGGGSIARRDGLGLLKVGPHSAGSEPGPACYGRGGHDATVTDANLALALLDPENFAGGTMKLDDQAASRSLECLGAELSLDIASTALGIRELANENMASAARVHAAERGVEPEKLALVVTGGGGPLHGAEVARKLGIKKMICPPAAGVASAIGLCLAPLRIDRSIFLGKPLAKLTGAEIETAFGELEEGIQLDPNMERSEATFMRSADMRYIGQGFEVEVALPAGPYHDTHAVLQAFRAAYERIFARTIDWADVEIVALRLVMILPLVDDQSPLNLNEAKRISNSALQNIVSSNGETVIAKQLVWDGAQKVIEGPALVAQSGSTLVLGSHDTASYASMGIGIINLQSEEAHEGEFDAVTTEVLWRRLIGIVDEASATLVRSAFSTVVRESDDFSVVITDAQGKLLAQGHKSIPSFIGSLPRTVEHFISVFKMDIDDGDILITNDPWWGTGHLADISLSMPIFHQGRIIAFVASTAHAPDIGGRSGAQRIVDVHEEGFQIPPLKLARKGVLDQAILALLAKNVRAPEEVLGDLYGQMAALDLVRKRVAKLLTDWRLPNFENFGTASFTRTDRAVRQALARLPQGSWTAEEETDGMDGVPIILKVKVTFDGEAVTVDYTGSSAQVPAALNVAWCYTFAFTSYALKCVLDPDSPNNDGSQRAIELIAPVGSIVNHVWPYSGGNRALVGHYLPALILRALADAIPDKIIAPTGSPIWSFLLRGQRQDGSRFALKTFFNGGMGATPNGNGQAALSWPSNVSSTPVEVIEQQAPIQVLYRRIRNGSGGIGKYRGGDGLEQAHKILEGGPFSIGFNAERTRAPAQGILGGGSGACGIVSINGNAIDIKNSPFTLRPGDSVRIATPGGGGYGQAD